MAELDFTALNKLAYRGFETAEAQEQRDALIDQGFTILQGEPTPFDAPQAAQEAATAPPAVETDKTSSAPLEASEGKKTAFTDASGRRGYNALYRAAHDYHAQHNPPTVDRAYWQTHIAGEDDPPQAELDYWTKAAKDMAEVLEAYSRDPLLSGLLGAIYEELEREYKAIRAEAQKDYIAF